MGINECSQPASKSSWDSQDFGDVNLVLKMVHFRKPSWPQWVNWTNACLKILKIWKIAKINQNLKISYLKIETFQVEIGKHISWGQSRWDFKLSIFWKISFANKLIHQPNLFEL